MPLGAARHEPRARVAPPPAASPAALALEIRAAALALGFARVGFCPIEPFAEATLALERWLAVSWVSSRQPRVSLSTRPPSLRIFV